MKIMPAYLQFLLSDKQPPRIVKRERGHQVLILIPGVYSGKNFFERFVARVTQVDAAIKMFLGFT